MGKYKGESKPIGSTRWTSHFHIMHPLKLTTHTANNMNNSPQAQDYRRRATWLLASLAVVVAVSGCQKRCGNMDLGVVKLGMYDSYTPGPVELLEENVYHFRGPDYPQVPIPERIRKAVLRRFALHSSATPLVGWLQAQHFKCTQPAASDVACHLGVQVSLEERCELFGPTRNYQFEQTVDIAIQAPDKRIETVKVTYGHKLINEGK